MSVPGKVYCSLPIPQIDLSPSCEDCGGTDGEAGGRAGIGGGEAISGAHAVYLPPPSPPPSTIFPYLLIGDGPTLLSTPLPRLLSGKRMCACKGILLHPLVPLMEFLKFYPPLLHPCSYTYYILCVVRPIFPLYPY